LGRLSWLGAAQGSSGPKKSAQAPEPSCGRAEPGRGNTSSTDLDEPSSDSSLPCTADHCPEATWHLKAFIGEHYIYSDTPVFKALWENYNSCQFVENEGETRVLILQSWLKI
jgi:hypothetical protein